MHLFIPDKFFHSCQTPPPGQKKTPFSISSFSSIFHCYIFSFLYISRACVKIQIYKRKAGSLTFSLEFMRHTKKSDFHNIEQLQIIMYSVIKYESKLRKDDNSDEKEQDIDAPE
jgi:hypothetical protein